MIDILPRSKPVAPAGILWYYIMVKVCGFTNGNVLILTLNSELSKKGVGI